MTRRPNVSLIWCGNDQITEAGSDLGCGTTAGVFTDAPVNPNPLDPNAPM
jgi:hypothetical protein